MKDLFKKIGFILNKKDKLLVVGIFLLMAVSAILDLIGVSAILPIVSLLTSNETIITNDNVDSFNFLVQIVYKVFKIDSIDKISIFLLCGLGIFYLIKTGYAFFFFYAMNKYTMYFNRKLTKKQIETYLSMPYEYHLNVNSSTLIRKCTYDVSMFTSAVNGLLTLSIKSITSVAIVVYLIITDYRVTLIIGGLLAAFSIFIVIFLRPHIRRVAKKTQELNSDNYKYLSQSFNGIKESKITNSERFFINIYDSNIGNINKYNLRRIMYGSIPGHSIEFIGMMGLVLSLLVVIVFKDSIGETNTQIIETFAVFAYAVIKLLPYVTEINSQINSISAYKISIDSIYKDIVESKEIIKDDIFSNEATPIPFNDEIVLKDISFAYSSNSDTTIIKDGNCVIKKNTSVAFTGASGAGKTTIIDIILGLLTPQKGAVTVDGIEINTNLKGWRKNISYIPQFIYLMDDTIRNNIAFGIDNKNINDKDIWKALEMAELDRFIKSLPNGLDTVIGERGVRLSGGQRQRIGIARAFYRNTNIIVFDEATSALDFETEKNILDHVNERAKDHTLIIITHRLNTIQNCNAIYCINHGNIEKVK